MSLFNAHAVYGLVYAGKYNFKQMCSLNMNKNHRLNSHVIFVYPQIKVSHSFYVMVNLMSLDASMWLSYTPELWGVFSYPFLI